MKNVYQPLPVVNRQQAAEIIASGNINELALLPLSVGEHFTDWKAAQDICITLADHADEIVRGNAALGLAYIARTKGRLEKHLVKPILLRLLKNCGEYRWRVVDAIEDINLYMGWQLGEKALGHPEE